MARNIFKGMGVALVTPFTNGGEIDYEALGRLVDYQLANGADFMCIMGTTAETPCLTAKERRELKCALVDRVRGRVPLLMGCGGNCTASVAEELREGDWTGIDGVLSVCPMYNKPSQEGLYRHFATVAEVSPVPVVLYNVPGRTGVNLSAETAVRLARDFRNIVAVKEAGGSLPQADEIIRNKPRDFDVLSGDDGITLPMISLGAVGVISVIGNALPSDVSRMVRLALQGKHEQALRIHRRLSELVGLLFKDGNPAGIKAMLHAMGMIDNNLRLPLVPARPETVERITRTLSGMRIR